MSPADDRRAATSATALFEAAPAVELAPGLTAISPSLPADERVSWCDPALGACIGVNAYVIREGDAAMVVDSNVALFHEAVLRRLELLLAGADHIQLYLTRPLEYDCQGNAAEIVARFPVAMLWTTLPPHYVNPRHGVPLPFPSTRTYPEGVSARTPRASSAPAIELGATGRHVNVIHPQLRNIMTTWLYDEATRTLFTADSLSHVYRAADDGPRPVTSADDGTDVATVRRHLLAKHRWWLVEADVAPLVADVRRIFDTCEVERIAPAFGEAIVGAASVRRHTDLLCEALHEIAEGAE